MIEETLTDDRLLMMGSINTTFHSKHRRHALLYVTVPCLAQQAGPRRRRPSPSTIYIFNGALLPPPIKLRPLPSPG